MNQIEEVRKRLQHVDAIWVAGKWSFHFKSKKFQSSLFEELAKMEQLGKPVLLFAQVPMLDGNVQRSRRLLLLGLEQSSSVNEEYQTSNQRLLELTASRNQVDYFDGSHLRLFESAPFLNGDLIYFDSHHLNEVGLTAYAKQATEAIESWVESNF